MKSAYPGDMKTVTVAQLRQNPTAMLAEVENGATYRITRHNREIGRIVPPGAGATLIPAKRAGRARTSELARLEVQSAESLDALLDEMKGEW